tara:strand:+ start:29 stop:364 length:336 start_codon:yes stop_codon:yes gene_type:complete
MKKSFHRNMLNQYEKYALVEHLKKNLDRCDNKSNEDIAKFCNEEFDFSRQDGRQIKIVEKHIENLYHILLNAGAEVWTKKEKKKTMSHAECEKMLLDHDELLNKLRVVTGI